MVRRGKSVESVAVADLNPFHSFIDPCPSLSLLLLLVPQDFINADARCANYLALYVDDLLKRCARRDGVHVKCMYI